MAKKNERKNYYPSVVNRLQTVNTQIAEFEAIVFRNDLELEIETAMEGNVKHMTTEVNANFPILQTKLDTLYKIRDDLEKELVAEQGEA